jgi:hypothetical protein
VLLAPADQQERERAHGQPHDHQVAPVAALGQGLAAAAHGHHEDGEAERDPSPGQEGGRGVLEDDLDEEERPAPDEGQQEQASHGHPARGGQEGSRPGYSRSNTDPGEPVSAVGHKAASPN